VILIRVNAEHQTQPPKKAVTISRNLSVFQIIQLKKFDKLGMEFGNQLIKQKMNQKMISI